jgi:DNA-binding MarR family transcriptional regulator
MTQQPENMALVRAIRRLSRAVDLQSRAIHRLSGLTLPQLLVLQCVRDLGEGTGRALSEAVDLSPPTVVGILDKLEAKGLIARQRSTRDRRIVHTRLTEAGRSLLARSPSPLGDRFEAGFMALGREERREIVLAVEKAAALAGPAADALDEPEEAPRGAAGEARDGFNA